MSEEKKQEEKKESSDIRSDWIWSMAVVLMVFTIMFSIYSWKGITPAPEKSIEEVNSELYKTCMGEISSYDDGVEFIWTDKGFKCVKIELPKQEN